MPDNARMQWMDLLRGLAAVLIAALHATLVMEKFGHQPAPELVEVNAIFRGYRIPLLMVLSGMLLPRALAKPSATFLSGKISAILYPYILWATILGIAFFQAKLLTVGFWIGGNYLWFLIFLFSYFVIALLLRSVPTFLLIAGASIVSFLAPDESKYFERYFFLMAMFFVGKAFAENPGFVERLSGWKAALVTGVCAVAVTFLTLQNDAAKYWIEIAPLTVGAILFMIWLAKEITSTPPGRALQFVGRNAIVFYVAHYPVIAFVTLFSFWAGVRQSATVSLLAFPVALAICSILALARERRGWGEWLYTLPKPLRGWLTNAIGSISEGRISRGGRAQPLGRDVVRDEGP